MNKLLTFIIYTIFLFFLPIQLVQADTPNFVEVPDLRKFKFQNWREYYPNREYPYNHRSAHFDKLPKIKDAFIWISSDILANRILSAIVDEVYNSSNLDNIINTNNFLKNMWSDMIVKKDDLGSYKIIMTNLNFALELETAGIPDFMKKIMGSGNKNWTAEKKYQWGGYSEGIFNSLSSQEDKKQTSDFVKEVKKYKDSCVKSSDCAIEKSKNLNAMINKVQKSTYDISLEDLVKSEESGRNDIERLEQLEKNFLDDDNNIVAYMGYARQFTDHAIIQQTHISNLLMNKQRAMMIELEAEKNEEMLQETVENIFLKSNYIKSNEKSWNF